MTPGHIIGGKYSLERQIGGGAMGTIWIALDTQLHRRVALKLMRAENLSASGSRERFEREARAIAQLRDPHVIQIHDYGVDGDCPFIVMELLGGEDLEARLIRQGTMSLATASGLVAQAARALGAAHAVGIIHRDLKPANIFLVASGAVEIVKLLDFGVATTLAGFPAESLLSTRTGALVGTPSYMSPEQARGRPIDHRTDLWSLAVVAYRALTGRLPFVAGNFGELVVEICASTPPPPSSLVPGLPAAVDAFFERALAKDPGERFGSARAFSAALAAVAEGAQPTQSAKILVVDDEPDVALLVKQRFRSEIRKSVYTFIFASDGEGALTELRNHPDIEVILSDINMPGMDGLTLLERAAEVSPTIRVIMVSAYGDLANIRAAMNRGAVDFLIKPIDFVDLALTLKKEVLRAKQVRQGLAAPRPPPSVPRPGSEDGGLRGLLSGSAAAEALFASVVCVRLGGVLPASAIDPEAAIQRIKDALDIVVKEVAACGGAADTVAGGAVLAVFQGRDHGARAVDACLSLRAALEPHGGGAAIGAAAGEIYAGAMGGGAMGGPETAVVGAPADAAASLAAVAARDEILLDDVLFEIVRGAFCCRPLDEGARRHTSRISAHAVIVRGSPPPVAVSADAATIAMNRKP